MEERKTILLIEDDPSICQVITLHLQREGFNVLSVPDGGEGLRIAREGDAALVILDLQLQGLGGIEVCKLIRKENQILPIIILSTRAEEIDKVIGLEIGADDYVTKPFSVYELAARIRARLRIAEQPHFGSSRDSSQGAEPRSSGVLTFGSLIIDVNRRKVTRAGVPIHLTATEFDVLVFLAEFPGQPVSREMLLESVWNLDAPGYADSVTALIQRLRQKIEVDPANPLFIQTVRGVGYRFAELEELDSQVESKLER